MVSLKKFYENYLKSKRFSADNKVKKDITILNLKNQQLQIASILSNEKKKRH